ncbi:S1 RNA-binding domain-containing protein [Patescibacteria group bacterium]|nr:S1 RNA-binding domain-containing protein [Patescibacteria group bacterium]MBU1256195.1 S1 RNA-binding domain-containing protein [Patescibacteria group bacterium]MBU1457788.1 S1 RNA-binding domain-containing protein [Patescibacteria group bacterium]
MATKKKLLDRKVPHQPVQDSKMSLMDRLLSKSKVEPKALRRGQEVEGVVSNLGRKLLLLNIGAKTEGIVTGDDALEVADLLAELKIGDTIKAFVKYPENDQGQIVLSLKKAAEAGRWEKYAQMMAEEKEIDVVGLEVNKGGMVVKCGEMRGFVPTSQFGEKHLGKMEDLINTSFKVKIIEVDREQNRLIFSEKQVSDSKAMAKRHEALEGVKKDEKLVGTVSGIMPFGVFVTVSVGKAKVEGLIHISEISWKKVDDPNTLFKVGQEVNVQVIGIEKKVGKLNLSMKRLSKDPWDDIEKTYAVGTKHKGKVVRSAPYGVFINFESGIDGLIHVTNKPVGREFEVGEDVEVFVEKVDGKNRRMSLGMVLTEVPVGYK